MKIIKSITFMTICNVEYIKTDWSQLELTPKTLFLQIVSVKQKRILGFYQINKKKT